MTNIRRSYIDNAEGQLHVLSWMGSQSDQPPLICLPPVPFGGRFFASFATAYEGQVRSADLSGYGGANPLVDAPTVADFTRAMSPLLAASSTPVWLTGFHSGALVAIDMAQSFPEQVAGFSVSGRSRIRGARHGITARLIDRTASISDTGRSVKRAVRVDGC